MTHPQIVDSSGWLEYFADTERASLFAPAIEDKENLIVPVLTIYEVFKKVLRERGEEQAIQIASVMQSVEVIEISTSLVLEAPRYSLPLADSLIYATAIRRGAILWTQDEHFETLPQVKYFRK